MPIRKSDDIENESDDRYENVRDSHSRAKITKRFDASTHNPYPGDEALQYLNRKLDDVIDSANTNDAKTGITGTQAGHITANNAKTGITSGQATEIAANTLKTGVTITENFTIAFGVRASEDTGAPETLTITIVNRTEGVEAENATKTVDLSLR